MLIRLTFGSREGKVLDFLPHEARAMLADGRAVLPDAEPVQRTLPAGDRVASRADRGMPRGKRRAVR
jgi:hypothetical protein